MYCSRFFMDCEESWDGVLSGVEWFFFVYGVDYCL